MTNEPQQELLRMRHIVEWTGLTRNQIRPLIECGILKGDPLKPGGRKFYHREHVREVFFKNSKPTPTIK